MANVLIENREAGALINLVERMSPDLVLLVETDSWWDRHLEPLKRAYPRAISHPLENSYGIHLLSQFELIEPEIRFLVDEDVPSIKTGLRLRSGARINLYGLHPKPPPLQDTEERDAELLIVGHEDRAEGSAFIVAGDLIDVAWSRTNSLFRDVSGLLDPGGARTIRHLQCQLAAAQMAPRSCILRGSFRLLDLAVTDDIESDHFPFFVALCHAPSAANVQDQPQPDATDLKEADEAIEKGRKKTRECG